MTLCHVYHVSRQLRVDRSCTAGYLVPIEMTNCVDKLLLKKLIVAKLDTESYRRLRYQKAGDSIHTSVPYCYSHEGIPHPFILFL
jgi:hypothetical protein